MANKKCPKCGEDNPAEAVMCWACYTPLTAGAGAAMGAGMGMGGAGAATMPRPGGPMGIPGAGAPADDGGKKQIDPKIFVLIGLIAIGGLIALFTSGVLSGPPVTDTVAPILPTEQGFPSGVPVPPPPPPVSGVSPSSGSPSAGNSQPSGPPPPSYSMIVSPNPQEPTATFGIAPAQPVSSKQEAVNLARQARQELAANGKWTSMQIFVFSDANSGSAFRQYMNQRRGKPLGPAQYAELGQQSAWTGATVFYETRGKQARIGYPADNPNGWWSGLR